MFIIDQQHNLIAAGQDDLARWGFEDIYEAARAFQSGDLRLDPDGGKLISSRTDSSFSCSTETLPSIFGPLKLCMHEQTEETFENLILHDVPQSTDLDEILSLPEKEEEEREEESPLRETEKSAEEEAEETVTFSRPDTEEIPEELSKLLSESPAEEQAPESETEESTLEKAKESAEEKIPEEISELLPEPLAEEQAPEPETEESTLEKAEESAEEKIPEEISELLPEPLVEEQATEPETEESTLEKAEESAEEKIPEEISELLSESPAEEQEPEPETEEAVLELLPPQDETEETVHEKTTEEPDFPFPPEPEEEKHEDLPDLLNIGEETDMVPAEKTPESGGGNIGAAWEKLVRNFHPDLSSNAEKIELSFSEYSDLLKDFIEDSRKMKSDLLDEDATRRKETVMILKDAVTLLHLNPLDELLGHLEKADLSEREILAEEYVRLLDRLEESLSSFRRNLPEGGEKKGVSETEEPPVSPEETELQTPESETEETGAKEPGGKEAVPAAPEKPAVSEKEETAAATFSADELLEGVTPIPIEFSIHIAAEELNLPEDLVLEFINDFAKQGHEYLPVLIDAYRNGELEHLQKTAHMLKGAASNLRIEAMVENLYELQFDNDIKRAPERIRLFAGQLMSLDKYLQQMSA